MKKLKEKIYQYEAVFDQNSDGFTVTVPKLPGLVTEGKNLKSAKEMAKDAIRCYLEAALKDTLSKRSFAIRKEKITVAV